MDIRLDKKPFNGYIKFSLQFLYCGNICFQDTYIPICEIDIAVKFCYQKENFNVCWQSYIDFLTMSIFCHLYFQKPQIQRKTIYDTCVLIIQKIARISCRVWVFYCTKLLQENKLKGRKDLSLIEFFALFLSGKVYERMWSVCTSLQ